MYGCCYSCCASEGERYITGTVGIQIYGILELLLESLSKYPQHPGPGQSWELGTPSGFPRRGGRVPVLEQLLLPPGIGVH